MQRTYAETMGAKVIGEIISTLDTGNMSNGDEVVRHPGFNVWVNLKGEAIHLLLDEIRMCLKQTGSVLEAIELLTRMYAEGKMHKSSGEVIKPSPVDFLFLNEVTEQLEIMDLRTIHTGTSDSNMGITII